MHCDKFVVKRVHVLCSGVLGCVVRACMNRELGEVGVVVCMFTSSARSIDDDTFLSHTCQ